MSPSPISDRVAAFESEIPEYRAISPLSIASLLFGVASALSFADLWFMLLGVIAVVFGALALRNIRRFPTLLTGKSIAQAGVGIALAFCLSAATITLSSMMILQQKAAAFGRSYEKVLKGNNLADAFWYHTPPSGRAGATPREIFENFEKASQDKMAFEEQVGPVRRLLERANRPGATITFQEVEKSGDDRMSPYAVLLYKIQGGGEAHDHHDHKDAAPPPGEDSVDADPVYAAVEIRSELGDPPFSWHISSILFPYKLKSHALAVKPVDDGHGHGH
jgi:hypothetical protein